MLRSASLVLTSPSVDPLSCFYRLHEPFHVGSLSFRGYFTVEEPGRSGQPSSGLSLPNRDDGSTSPPRVAPWAVDGVMWRPLDTFHETP